MLRSKFIFAISNDFRLNIDGCVIPCSIKVKSLGVILDNTFNDLINYISRTPFFNLENIAMLHSCLTQESAQALVNALVMSSIELLQLSSVWHHEKPP